jgi:hypothetical protein
VLETRKHSAFESKGELLRKRECENGHRFFTVEKLIALQCKDRNNHEQLANSRRTEKRASDTRASLQQAEAV